MADIHDLRINQCLINLRMIKKVSSMISIERDKLIIVNSLIDKCLTKIKRKMSQIHYLIGPISYYVFVSPNSNKTIYLFGDWHREYDDTKICTPIHSKNKMKIEDYFERLFKITRKKIDFYLEGVIQDMELDDEYDLMPRLWKKFLTCFNIERSLKYRGKQQLSICKEYQNTRFHFIEGLDNNVLYDKIKHKSKTTSLQYILELFNKIIEISNIGVNIIRDILKEKLNIDDVELNDRINNKNLGIYLKKYDIYDLPELYFLSYEHHPNAYKVFYFNWKVIIQDNKNKKSEIKSLFRKYNMLNTRIRSFLYKIFFNPKNLFEKNIFLINNFTRDQKKVLLQFIIDSFKIKILLDDEKITEQELNNELYSNVLDSNPIKTPKQFVNLIEDDNVFGFFIIIVVRTIFVDIYILNRLMKPGFENNIIVMGNNHIDIYKRFLSQIRFKQIKRIDYDKDADIDKTRCISIDNTLQHLL